MQCLNSASLPARKLLVARVAPHCILVPTPSVIEALAPLGVFHMEVDVMFSQLLKLLSYLARSLAISMMCRGGMVR
jgi:hypothetical protein